MFNVVGNIRTNASLLLHERYLLFSRYVYHVRFTLMIDMRKCCHIFPFILLYSPNDFEHRYRQYVKNDVLFYFVSVKFDFLIGSAAHQIAINLVDQFLLHQINTSVIFPLPKLLDRFTTLQNFFHRHDRPIFALIIRMCKYLCRSIRTFFFLCMLHPLLL